MRLFAGPGASSPGAPERQAAQDWLPVADIRDGCLVRPDGTVVAGVSVAPLNLSLKSDIERRAIVAAVHQAVTSLTAPMQILSVFRPVDLDAYLATLDSAAAASGGIRRQVLADYRRWVGGLVTSGEAVERRYYVLATRTGPDAVIEHRTAMSALAADLCRGPGMSARVMDAAAWRELLFLAFHSDQSAVEPVPDSVRLPPLFRGDRHAEEG